MTLDFRTSIEDFVEEQNKAKHIFTAGPAALLAENIIGLQPCFGRGDFQYEALEKRVINQLKSMSGHEHLVRLQGSASLALEIAIKNFVYGNVLVINTGYYSDRIYQIVQSAQNTSSNITNITYLNFATAGNILESYDWVLACSTETSIGYLQPIDELKLLTSNLKGKLLLDATASIGLEDNHDLADVICFSSCKGLFGLTGAAFIASHELPNYPYTNSFYLNYYSHMECKMTGPYHTICSLANVLSVHPDLRAKVIESKQYFVRRMKNKLKYPNKNQPCLCTYVECKIQSTSTKAVLYEPRSKLTGSVVCHLGEIHLGNDRIGSTYSLLEVEA